ncbi:Beta-lactamase class C [Acidisarcina polymorpha]|uniref:Beta-lactamase class C n=1 Tax=Acidisarcina polymorpha TaxID=2211140 RepID=A0A2Z5GB77_9BACT|nr:serine hydrolase domain-containing protein [Acidisarcina polymorpha]AXC15885.1 Beta-lactamase class C [Acidisarcina polymorpha]
MNIVDTPAEIIATTLNQRIRFADAYSVLQDAIAERAFPGASFGVFYEGKILALDGLGGFTYDEDSPVVQPGTIYDLASITKVLGATSAAMLLYERGRLDLDQILGEILPGFVIGMPSARERCRVTLRMLLAHSSGLPAYAPLFEANRTPNALLAACLRMPLESTPGARSEYSDIGFILLGKALEILAGEELDRFCNREVFQPLGLTATGYKPPLASRNFIPPTEDDKDFRQRVIQGEVHDENCFVLGGISGHAGLFSNALDVLRYASCIVSSGKTEKGEVLFSPETLSLFARRQDSPSDSSRALGWDTPSGDSSSGHHFSSHSVGHLGYTGTSLWIDLDRRLAVTLLTNRTWPDRSSQAIRKVRPAFYDAVFNAIARGMCPVSHQ